MKFVKMDFPESKPVKIEQVILWAKDALANGAVSEMYLYDPMYAPDKIGINEAIEILHDEGKMFFSKYRSVL